MTELDDLGLRLPIGGVQLIEASAGTGKTFALATLYSRLVIEIGLPVSAILAVTFTESATKELREKLRERLLLSQRLLEATLTQDVHADDAHANYSGIILDSEEARLSRRLVDAAIAREGASALRRRLRLACEQMDLAPIHTIHGFCRRALADHALEAGRSLLEPELIENEAALRREVALEFWREHSREAEGAATLDAIWSSPEALGKSLRDLLALDVLLPAPVTIDEAPQRALDAACEQLAAAFRQHGEAARAQLRSALADGSLYVIVARDSAVDPVWKALDDWLQQTPRGAPNIDKLENYSSAVLKDKTRKEKGVKKITPNSPLFDAIDVWRQCQRACERVALERRIALVHAARDFARQRMQALKRQRGLLGYDDMVRDLADALDGAGGEVFAQGLQAQYTVALVDEFQDTDPRQWSIFRRLFAMPTQAAFDPAAARSLFLIGDPKQAIYRFRGGDVFTYLSAQEQADGKHHLARNFRSRPLALAGVQALFELSGPDAFAQDGIAFEPVHPGGSCRDEHLQIGGANAPGLNLLLLAPGEDNIEHARERATQACVASLRALLAAGLAGTAQLVDRRGVRRAVAPGDIAVLVERHKDADRMQRALARAGIASVAAGRSSLYDSEEAQHLCWLFEALLAPADEPGLRAALATPLFGFDAAALIAFDSDESVHRAWQDRMQYFQQRAQRFGPVALLGEVCAENAPRLLALHDGERRLSNYLQLAEELQAADARTLGLAGVLAELERRIEDADEANDAELLRLESDAARVKILTLHKSKGLEFELVFLPYAATSGAERPPNGLKMARYHDGEQRVAMLFAEKGDAARRAEQVEERAEDLRLLYVGLTRARLATWVVWGAAKDAHKTALAWLLHRAPGATDVEPIDASLDRRTSLLRAQAPAAISLQHACATGPWPRLPFATGIAAPAAALAQRALDRDWWVYSFSQLAREESGVEARGADDEIDVWPELAASRFSGTRFGNCLHAALENVAMEKWLDCETSLPPTGEFDVVANALRDHGYASANDLEEGVPLLTGLIAETLNARMPEGTRLAMLPDAARRNEMEFHFALASTAITDVLALLHRFGIVAERNLFGQRHRLEGLLTGRIDLVYESAGRFYVVDYKSNQLRDYGAAALASAVRDSEYDLQYVLYSLALHRWLRFKLGEAYRIAEHLGGIRYLFCRGLDRRRDDAPGIHALSLPPALIEGLDALLRATPP
jgi:exodeoxyribonuclease V beta subunit